MATHTNLRRLFKFYNKKYFANCIPEDTSVMWAPMDHNLGEYQRPGEIRIDTTLQGSPKLAHIIMLHEMIHARFPKATHGRVFKAERQRLWELGAYEELL